MKKTLAASILVLTFAFPALADDSWPRNPIPGADNNGGARAIKAPAAAYNAWSDDFVPFGSSAAATSADKGGQHPTSQAELDAAYRAHMAYWRATNAALITPAGTLAPVLPVRVHERLNARAFGSPVMQGAQ